MPQNIRDAVRWLVNKHGGKVGEAYKDRVNVNYLNRVVGYRYEIKGRKFFVTFRPRGTTSYTRKGHGAMTLMNSSEIKFQLNEGRDRLVIFKDEDIIRLYIFLTDDIIEYLRTTEKLDFREKFADYPDESELAFNIPLRLGINFEDWLITGKLESTVEEEKEENSVQKSLTDF
jgi:hypothetical protein